MIYKLILKDLYAHKKILILGFVAHLLLGLIFTARFYRWNIYMMQGYLAISFVCLFILFQDKKSSTESMICSLPVSRSGIVISKYILSLLITVPGLFLWIYNSYLINILFSNSVTQSDQVLKLKVVFMALFFFSVALSIFLPSIFKFRFPGMIFTAVIAIFFAILTIPYIFYPYKHTYRLEFIPEDFILICILFIILIMLLTISIIVSLIIYNRRDLF